MTAQTSSDQCFLTRKDLAFRWQCSAETIKRRQRAGLLKALHIGPHIVRYLLADVLDYETKARA